MKDYIKKFNDFSSADGYKIQSIPWIGTAVKTDGRFNLRTKESNKLIEKSGDKLTLVPMLLVAGGTWDGSGSNNETRLFISGDVTLTGKTDCYSIEFLTGGHLTINAGARLRIWQGGIVNNNCTAVNYLTIVEDSVNDSYGEFLLHPGVTANNHPLASVELIGRQIGKDQNNEYHWYRFSLPIPQATTWQKIPNVPSYIYVWSYVNNDWESITTLTKMKPFSGSLVAPSDASLMDVKYIFLGELIGCNGDKSLEFVRDGYHFFGNSFSGKISCKNILEKISYDFYIAKRNNLGNYDHIQITNDNVNSYPYVFPYDTFLFHNPSSSTTSIHLSYKDLVWDPSFEEEVTPTLSLSKGSLMSSPKPTEIDTTLGGSGIFDNLESSFSPNHDEK